VIERVADPEQTGGRERSGRGRIESAEKDKGEATLVRLFLPFLSFCGSP
jgi:hypothetical protein